MHAAPQAYACMRTHTTRTTHTHVRICARARVWGNAPNSLLVATYCLNGRCCGKYKKVAKKFVGFGRKMYLCLRN